VVAPEQQEQALACVEGAFPIGSVAKGEQIQWQ